MYKLIWQKAASPPHSQVVEKSSHYPHKNPSRDGI